MARSQEVAVAGSFLALVVTMAIAGGPMVHRTMAEMRTVLIGATSVDALGSIGRQALTLAAILAGPFLFAAMVTGIGAGVAQVGVRFNVKLAKPKAKNLALKRGIERLRPAVASWELARSILKLSAVAAVVWPTLSAWRDHLANDRTLAGAIDRLTGVYGGVLLRATILALLIAIADYAYQRRRTTQKIMMSRQDIRREFRDSEGDPILRATRRRRQTELSRNRMLHDVASADVVLANPVHLAVALRYDPDEGAPRIVAKGADVVAERIRLIARRHGVPITTDIPLARALFRQCRIGQYVPSALYEAVAVVLAEAYRRTRRTPGTRRTVRVA